MQFLKKNILLVTFLLFANCFATQAQHHFEYTYYTQDNGLASAVITEIQKDSSGFLWLISENGLMRFDGYEFKLFRHDPMDSNSISSSYVTQMVIDKKGNVFVKNSYGISKYLPATQSFKTIIPFNNNRDVKIIAVDTEGTWVLKKNALLLIRQKDCAVQIFTLPVSIKVDAQISSIKQGNHVFLLNNGVLSNFDIKTKKIELVSIVGAEKINSIFKYKNQLWVLTHDGISEINISEKKVTKKFDLPFLNTATKPILFIRQYQSKYLLIGYSINDISIVDFSSGENCKINLEPNEKVSTSEIGLFNCSISNKVWFGVANNFYNVDLKKKTVLKYSINPSSQQFSAKSNVGYIFDDGNIIWIASHGLGLTKAELLNNSFKSFHPFENNEPDLNELSNNIRTVVDWDNDNYLVGAISGIFLFNKKTSSFKNIPEPYFSKLHSSTFSTNKIIVDADGNFWIASRHADGAYILNKNKHSITQVNPFSKTEFNTVKSILIDSKKNVWLSTSNNVIYRTPLTNIFSKHNINFIKYTLDNNEIDRPFNTIFTIVENKKGEILFASETGFYIYNYKTNQFKRFYSKDYISDCISESNTRCIYEAPDGFIWLGTNGGGLNRFDPATEKFIHFTTKDGLPENYIYSILPDRQGNLWLSTNKGIGCFNIKSKTCINYTLKDGLQNFEFNTNAALASQDGNFVMGGINGITIFNSLQTASDNDVPPISIIDFLVNGVSKPIQSGQVMLHHDENNITLKFAALSYFQNDENKYAYYLEGVDKTWTFCGTQRSVNYSNLPAGNYIFRVKACNSYGIWNETGSSISFYIITAWWRTKWFYFIVIGCVATIIYALYKYRLQHAIGLQKMRNNIARDLHDEVGSNLSSISLFNEVAKESITNTNDKSPVIPILEKIAEYTSISQESMSDIVWMINARNDSFENVIAHMQSFAAEVLEAKGINLKMEVDKNLEHQKMEMHQRKNFYLIFKEAINNIAKYANCKIVNVEIEIKNKIVKMKIADDGIGFDISKVSKGNGLLNMKKRATELNGQIKIKSEQGKGTTIELSFHI